MSDISFAQLRQLSSLQKLRKLTLEDLWPLPERYQLRYAYAELSINTNEPLFIIRAIIRMTWKPMIPIHIAGMLFQLLPVLRTMLNGYVYHCLDSPDNPAYYKACMAAVGMLLIEVLAIQRGHLANYVLKEKCRVSDSLVIGLERQPLIYSGLSNVVGRYEHEKVKNLANRIISFQDIISDMFGTMATILPIYYQVGAFAFIPLAVSSGINASTWLLTWLVGSKHEWDPTGGCYPGDSVDDIYPNVKTVKMFGWERMYLDP
ncbi:hypothetical protein GGF41_003492, partial [Coemansia sp. RSA 2531]